MTTRHLETIHGSVTFPTFMPVTTFGGKYPLDELVRPYLRRLSTCAMVSYHYAKNMRPADRPAMPLFIDSGGFASLFEGSRMVSNDDVAIIETKDGDTICPHEVLDLQERHADIGATLDFLVPPTLAHDEAVSRQTWTIKNALWALAHRKSNRLKLYASIQAWDEPSTKRIMSALVDHAFDGFALGGMVPRVKHPDTILSIVKAIRAIDDHRPLHVFGIGQPELMLRLFKAGVDSTDSSSFLRATAEKRFLEPLRCTHQLHTPAGTTPSKCHCDACRTHDARYFSLTGETNNLALALHNLAISQAPVHHNMSSLE